MIKLSDRMIVINVMVKRIIISLTSDLTVYAPRCGLGDSQKSDFYDSFMNVIRKLRVCRAMLM